MSWVVIGYEWYCTVPVCWCGIVLGSGGAVPRGWVLLYGVLYSRAIYRGVYRGGVQGANIGGLYMRGLEGLRNAFPTDKAYCITSL